MSCYTLNLLSDSVNMTCTVAQWSESLVSQQRDGNLDVSSIADVRISSESRVEYASALRRPSPLSSSGWWAAGRKQMAGSRWNELAGDAVLTLYFRSGGGPYTSSKTARPDRTLKSTTICHEAHGRSATPSNPTTLPIRKIDRGRL